MFWILRRTGAASFFNSLNNNCSTSKGGGNQTQDKYVKRPPRKEYGRLSGDSDDAQSIKQKIDDPFDDLDNFELITNNGNGNGNGTNKNITNGCTHGNDNCVGAAGLVDCHNGNVGGCSDPDCQGNFDNFFPGGLCNNNTGNGNIQKNINESTLNRLQAMAMSDDDDYDESLTCNVCDRAFHCHRQLASHQQKKRHFGCSGCDSLFPSLMLLEHHKEEFEHWSDDEIGRRVCCRRNRGDDYFTDTDSFTSEAESEDLERLL